MKSLKAVRLSTCTIAFACLVAGALTADSAQAQTHFRPGGYLGIGGIGINPTTGSVHVPGQSVIKPSGRYDAIGNGYYRNHATGNIYNPTTRSYTQNQHFSFRPGQYHRSSSGIGFNPTSGSLHVPGRAVVKPSGVYHAIGNGYYRNPVTGNTYNPTTRSYKSW